MISLSLTSLLFLIAYCAFVISLKITYSLTYLLNEICVTIVDDIEVILATGYFLHFKSNIAKVRV